MARSKPAQVAAFWVSYPGAGFHGFQAQQGLRTVQGELLRAFSEVGLPRNPVVGGRTDKGVSARMQVLSAKVYPETDLERCGAALNAVLPPELRVRCVRPACTGFHAAWSASGKVYRYDVPAGVAGSIDRLEALAPLFEGTRDFRVFHHKTSEVRMRRLERVRVARRDGGVRLTFEGEQFGRHMVRMITGALLGCARGECEEAAVLRGLEAQENFHCPIAPPEPLTLWEVRYPPEVDPFSAADRERPE